MSSQRSISLEMMDPAPQQSQTMSVAEPPSSSQLSVASSTNPDTPPAIFRRVNRQRHILYDADHALAFHVWWVDTIHGRLNGESGRHKIRWDGTKSSPHWENFDQAANCATGEPLIRCKLCHKMLNHPHVANTGTNNLNIHVKSVGCRKSRNDSTAQVDLPTMMNKVSSYQQLCGNDIW